MVKSVEKPSIPLISVALGIGDIAVLLGRLNVLSLQAGLNFAVFIGLWGLPLVASSLQKH